MPVSTRQKAFIAFQRFGYGPRPGDLDQVGTDARGFLRAEVGQPDVALISAETGTALGLAGTTASAQTTFAAQDARRALRNALAASTGASPPGFRSEALAEREESAGKAMQDAAAADAHLFRNEALARFRKAVQARAGFAERLVAFWSNHFCVSIAKNELVRSCAGSFEREAIRPHVFGRFADLLLAVEQHPAMLLYLDNAQSVGPDARGNGNHKRGLNENLAREILELHTLGVDAGYSQADVTGFARVLTGWTFAGREGRLGEPGSFVFNANLHEPGEQTVFGKTYGSPGFGQGEAALLDVARHPATAHHIATKLVRHFIADDPPKAAVDRIASVFAASDGDLRLVSLSLLDLPQAWEQPPHKMRTPYDYLIAANRLLANPPADPGPILNGLRSLGMPLWEPAEPNGFPDIAGAWASPEGLQIRLDLAAQMAHGYRGMDSPAALLEAAFGPAASDATRAAVTRAESPEQAIALILMAPEFQRR